MYLYYTDGKSKKTDEIMDNAEQSYYLMDDKTANYYNVYTPPTLVETHGDICCSVYVGHIKIKEKIEKDKEIIKCLKNSIMK